MQPPFLDKLDCYAEFWFSYEEVLPSSWGKAVQRNFFRLSLLCFELSYFSNIFAFLSASHLHFIQGIFHHAGVLHSDTSLLDEWPSGSSSFR